MRYTWYGLLAMCIILLAGSERRVSACLCYTIPPPCVRFWQADAVFSGLVTRISPDPKDYEASGRIGKRTVIFELEQAYRGVTGTEVRLESAISDCESSFEEGKRFFVYAWLDKDTNTLGTNACSGNELLSDASEDLAFVKKLSQGTHDLQISGIVLEDSDTPVKNLAIQVEGNGKEYKVTTNDKGRFELAVAEPGKYVVRMVMPVNWLIVGAWHQVEKITKVAEENGHRILEYTVEVEPAKCVFLDVPILVYKKGS